MTSLAGCSSGGVNLSGVWSSDGYNCTDRPGFIRETVRIVQTGSHIVATKTHGDDCVKSGHVSFQGDIHGKKGLVDYWLASLGGAPTLALFNQPLSVTNSDRFTVTFEGRTVVYTRTKSGSGLNWLVLVLGLVVVLGGTATTYRTRRSRRGRSSGQAGVPHAPADGG